MSVGLQGAPPLAALVTVVLTKRQNVQRKVLSGEQPHRLCFRSPWRRSTAPLLFQHRFWRHRGRARVKEKQAGMQPPVPHAGCRGDASPAPPAARHGCSSSEGSDINSHFYIWQNMKRNNEYDWSCWWSAPLGSFTGGVTPNGGVGG